MKPGNLSERKRCQIRRQTKDEGSIQRTSNLRCAIFLWFGRKAALLRFERIFCSGDAEQNLSLRASNLLLSYLMIMRKITVHCENRKELLWKKDCLPPNA